MEEKKNVCPICGKEEVYISPFTPGLNSSWECAGCETKAVCAFVNINQPPREVKFLGVFSYQDINGLGKVWEFKFSELAEVHYPHPEVPELARLPVLEWIPIQTKNPLTLRNYIDQGKEISKGLKL